MQKSKRQDTRAALLRAGERLFAEKGLAGVSVRDITLAAGARNQSALHYHFGSIEELIREIFARRFQEIEAARIERLAGIDAAGKGQDVQALMEANIGPLFEACLDENGRLYARFSVQLMTDPRYNVGALVRDIGIQSAIEIGERLRTILHEMPAETLSARLRQVFIISVILMADYSTAVERGTAPEIETAIREAAATLAGYLMASPPIPGD